MGNDNPLILAVETSGRMGSVAVAQGPKLLAEKQFTGPMRHSAEIFPAIVGLLKQFGKKPADIEQVHISVGPGSFTGLRIAVTLAKTMALTNGAKIAAVDTLDCIAANVIDSVCSLNAGRCPLPEPNERLATILDAKRSQFFIAVYEKTSDTGWKKILPGCLMTVEEFLDHCGTGFQPVKNTARMAVPRHSKPIALIGEGLVYYKDKFNAPAVRVLDEKLWNPSAANVHKLGWHKALLGDFADPLTLTPNYLRGPDAKMKSMNTGPK